jgi:hypothetical protein
MTFGLVSAIGIMIVEMLLFIRRATQMEGAFEKKPSALQEADAQMRSGALLTSLPSNYSNYNGEIKKIIATEAAARNDCSIGVEEYDGIFSSESDPSKKTN